MERTARLPRSQRAPRTWQALGSLALASLLWVAIFGFKVVNFWLGMSCAAALLAGLAICWSGVPLDRRELTHRNIALGILATAALYGLFALGRLIAVHLLPFAAVQIGSIYAIREEAAPGLIAVVLFCLTSPCEEIFWRGFLQRWAMDRWGGVRGWLAAALCYAGVHVASGNFMLTGAALVAGLFWGWVYLRTASLYICIISHATWTVAIFLIWPMH